MKIRLLRGFANMYLLEDGGEVAVVDPASPPPPDIADVSFIALTHGHFDHYMHADDWSKGVLVHPNDVPIMEEAPDWVMRHFGIPVPPPPKIDGYLREGDELRLGGVVLSVWEIPGHSPGSVAIVGDGFILTGDLIFEMGGVGRTDLPGGDERLLWNSIRRVLSLPDTTLVYPGHGNPFTVREAKRWFRV
ncbi:MAG: MBL fold metallo-hydrolase [Thermotogae bacterium]|nr:MBL fold metallo-hydrolase [Thermotogota bacterium]